MERILHILFDAAGAPNLETSFRIDPTLADDILVLEEDWSCGPWDREPGLPHRLEWSRSCMGEPEKPGPDRESRNLAERLRQTDDLVLWFWVASNSRDICGFQRLAWDLREFPSRLECIYLNNLPFLNERLQLFFPRFLAELPAREFPKAKRLAGPLSSQQWEAVLEGERELSLRNGVLRMGSGIGKIVTLNPDAFDGELLALCRGDWLKASRVAHQVFRKNQGSVSESYLLGRIRELAGAGNIQVQGDFYLRREFDIKIPEQGTAEVP